MIDPKELRIGNLVLRQGRKLIDLKDDVWAIDKVVPQSCQNYDPIPITPEWLERLGFEKDGTAPLAYQLKLMQGDTLNKTLRFFDIDDGFGVSLYDSQLELLGEPFVLDPDIEYVHQLQNLYFALTGQELTIKEPTLSTT